jgi:N6-adenosine-specific RNA methylase IME4
VATPEDPFADIKARIDEKGPFRTILIDPPWRFKNRTGKMAPEHKRLHRYRTLSVEEIEAVPVNKFADENCHLYIWTPNAMLPNALRIIEHWGFEYKTNLIWCKIALNGKPDKRGVGFYYRNVTEMLLFAIKGKARTRPPARSQENFVEWQKQEHSRKPPHMRKIIEDCSHPPYLELFAREEAPGWFCWGDQAKTYMETREVHPGYHGNGEGL